MQITFTGHHVEITDALRSYAEERLERLTHHFSDIHTIKVTLRVEKNSQIADAHIHMTGTDLHASADTADMYATLDALYDKLKIMVDKHKEKLKDHH